MAFAFKCSTTLLPCYALLSQTKAYPPFASSLDSPAPSCLLHNFSAPPLSLERREEVQCRRRSGRSAFRGDVVDVERFCSGLSGEEREKDEERFAVFETRGEERRSCEGDEDVEGDVSLVCLELELKELVGRVVGASAAGVAGLMSSAGRALADEVAASGTEVGEAVSAGAALVDEAGKGARDVVASDTISVLFVAATVGLVVLTGGVVYLSVTEWLEKRAIDAESKAVADAKKEKKSNEVVKAARAGPKGFGTKRLKDDMEE